MSPHPYLEHLPVLLRIGSHRARRRVESALGRELQGWYGLYPDPHYYYPVTEEEYTTLQTAHAGKRIPGVTQARKVDPATLQRCWNFALSGRTDLPNP